METKTMWKKNLDSKFISGDDLQQSLNGLSPEMPVILVKFNDEETFDQNKQSKIVRTGLIFKTIDGKEVYKPAILNKTNAKFFAKEFGSDFMEDWIGKVAIMYAQKDSRHGYVVRYKTYVKPSLILDSENFKNCKAAFVKDAKNLEVIKRKYNVTPEVEAALKNV
jgi:hypothetical protein